MKTLLLSLLLAGFAMVSFNKDHEASTTTPPKIIAKYDNEIKKFVINEKILRRTFADGSKIERFSIQKDGKNFFLVRRGIDGKKMHRSEAIALKRVGPGKLVLDFTVKWYTVCTAGACWCHKVGDSCECASSGTCFFGKVPIDDDIEVIVLG